MATKSRIIITMDPKGRFEEGTIGDTSKPGTAMMIQPGTPLTNGRPTWVSANAGSLPSNTGDGTPLPIWILMEDAEQGKLPTDAFVVGTRCRLYSPAPGEDMNVLAGEGTTQNFNPGDRLMLDSDVGNFIQATGSPQSAAFQVLDTLVNVAVPALVWCKYTGH